MAEGLPLSTGVSAPWSPGTQRHSVSLIMEEWKPSHPEGHQEAGAGISQGKEKEPEPRRWDGSQHSHSGELYGSPQNGHTPPTTYLRVFARWT